MSSKFERRPAVSIWFSAPRTVELRTENARMPAAREVRVEALYSGISHGSEMMVYRGEVPPELELDSSLATLQGSFNFPVKYGYANVGRVLDIGADVGDLTEGQLVFAFNPHETCYTVPASVLIKLPPEIDPRLGVFAANVETAMNAVLDAAPRLGERVVVVGQGVVGLLITQLMRKAGASLIITTDLYENRRRLSLLAGADLSIDPASKSLGEHVAAMTDGMGADIVIEASGQPAALDAAVKVTAAEGRVVVVSWYGTKRADLNLGSDFHRKRLTLKSSQVSNLDPSLTPRWTIRRRRNLAVGYLRELMLDEMISHVLSFNQAAEAYRLIDHQP
ncbi:MAG TPA: zinc-binding alcohol dehydrogenase, partial [Blastocatellia bacterium]|nr:zinc-binding alcohol dehydrogenase [Blastocatellia bacterium]